LAPLVAARLTGRALDPSEVAEAVRARAAREDLCVVEGIGGVLTPIAPGASYLDFAAGLGGAAIVVARPGLGTLNHTALTVRAVREAGVPVLGVVFSRVSGAPPDLAEETNPGVLAETVPAPLLATIAHLGAEPRADALPLAPFGPVADAVEASLLGAGGPSVRPAHELVTRVRYQETDQMGVVYHGNYLLYFEMGRTELLRELGLPYSDLEREGIRLAVTEATARYHAPARYDDRIKIRTRLAEVGRARIAFAYEVARADDGRLMAEGTTVLACLDASGRPRRLPERVLALLGATGRAPRPVAGARP
ncbi:MAG: YbgC/FadM family acyl-CoA thioesterase, partial [Planctomycetales bacterium]|nr:YbgC/FadM family acyl-CoA thioesterase [Planctomycetales bacterium]